MRFDKFTLKAQEVIQTSQQMAERFGHQQIEPEHLVRAILEQKEGVIPPLLGKIGADQSQVIQSLEAALEKIPRVSGTGFGQASISLRSKAVLDKAFVEAEQMKDEFVSLEHILLAVTEEKEGDAARLLAAAGITRDMILKALVDIRGGQRITDPNPEDKYQALDRFSSDLTA
ncbi:MAG: type VI secretion system ATPase TssH, partial [Deltaproteobacteria bacterium]|nr:type VI secretion system ATPase TssH [Deltaproteobacteria bacterium]